MSLAVVISFGLFMDQFVSIATHKQNKVSLLTVKHLFLKRH